jgi:hypothetical protein
MNQNVPRKSVVFSQYLNGMQFKLKGQKAKIKKQKKKIKKKWPFGLFPIISCRQRMNEISKVGELPTFD